MKHNIIFHVPQKVLNSNKISSTPDTTKNSTTCCYFEHNSNLFKDDIDFDDCSKAPADEFREDNFLGYAAGVSRPFWQQLSPGQSTTALFASHGMPSWFNRSTWRLSCFVHKTEISRIAERRPPMIFMQIICLKTPQKSMRKLDSGNYIIKARGRMPDGIMCTLASLVRNSFFLLEMLKSEHGCGHDNTAYEFY